MTIGPLLDGLVHQIITGTRYPQPEQEINMTHRYKSRNSPVEYLQYKLEGTLEVATH